MVTVNVIISAPVDGEIITLSGVSHTSDATHSYCPASTSQSPVKSEFSNSSVDVIVILVFQIKNGIYFFSTMYIILLFIIKLIDGSKGQGGCYYDGNEFCLNEEDIMSVDLLPGSFLLMDPTAKGEKQLEEFNNVTVDGSIDRAIDEMDFHR